MSPSKIKSLSQTQLKLPGSQDGLAEYLPDLNELSEKVVERKEELQSEPLPQMECTLSIREESEEDEEDEEEDDDDDKQQNARRSRSMTSKSPNGAKTANSNRGRRKSA